MTASVIPRLPAQAAQNILAGETKAIARCLSAVEQGTEGVSDLLDVLRPHTGRSRVVGFTGVGGAGKSTLISALASRFSASGCRLAVLAVDPTSARSGGALLGDRIRDSSDTEAVFYRSIASRGGQGGISRTLHDMVAVLEAAGRDPILIETVGSGQSEIGITSLAHTTVAVTAPGLGDEVQAMKSGVGELVSIHVVNKVDADPMGARRAAAHLRQFLPRHVETLDGKPDWTVPVELVSGRCGEGLDAVIDAILRHRLFLQESGSLVRWLKQRRRAHFRAALRDTLYEEARKRLSERVNELEHLVEEGGVGAARAAMLFIKEALIRGSEEDLT